MTNKWNKEKDEVEDEGGNGGHDLLQPTGVGKKRPHPTKEGGDISMSDLLTLR